MSLSNVFAVLQQYAGGGSGNQTDPQRDFDHVAQNASQQHLASGLAGAIRSDATPPFAQIISTLFANSDPQQKAGILGHLVNAAGAGASGGNINPQQVSPEAVQQLAQQAQQNRPSIIDEASSFYAQHPTVVKALGAGALAMIMSHMSQTQS